MCQTVLNHNDSLYILKGVDGGQDGRRQDGEKRAGGNVARM